MIERATALINEGIASRPGTIVAVFLVLTVVFAGGLSDIETETGQEQFIEDLPSWETLQNVQDDFGPTFGESSTTTQLIQRETNVLSKPSLLRMLRAQERIESADALRVTGTSSPASTVARQLDSSATTTDDQIRAVERATPEEIRRAVRDAADQPGFTGQLTEDFNRQSATASGAMASVSHARDVDGREERVGDIVDSVDGNVVVYGSLPDTITSSLILVLPAALVFILLFLVIAYRDPIDMLLGVLAIFVTIIWTFGFLGLAGIAFSVLLVAVPPLLLAVGIDFGIHAINRYREEREQGVDIAPAMQVTTRQLLAAFFIVTGTTVIGFLSNLVSALPPIRDFGIVAAVGIVFTFFIFGVFLPATKVWIDRARDRYPIPTVSERPLGSEGSTLGRVLGGGVVIARRAPVAFMLLVFLVSGSAGVYATGVDTGFSEEDFMPPEYDEIPEWQRNLPEPFRPAEYSYVERYNYVQDNFPQDSSVMLYVEAPMRRGDSLDAIHRTGRDPPDTFERDGRYADSESIVTMIQQRQERDSEFADFVARNDPDGDGIPEQNLGEVYDRLESSGAGVQGVLAEDRRSALITYSVDGDAENQEVAADAREVARQTSLDAMPTGMAVVFQEATGLIMDTVIQSLLITLGGAAVFLVLVYGVLEGRPLLGVANVVPIALTVTFVVASMRYAGLKFNAINGVLLSLTIGLGIDYSVHVTHRFADEFGEHDLETALELAVRGTGGALTGSMFTTVSGVGVLVFALNPALGAFGLLTALSVVFAYLASIVVLPSTLVIWDRVANRSRFGRWLGTAPTGASSGPLPGVDDAAAAVDDDDD